MTRNPLRAHKLGVQTAYTEQDVSKLVYARRDAGKSLRAIAVEYGPPVNHMDIERILQGKFPHNLAKRAALNLPPICMSCGQKVHRVRVVPAWVHQAAQNLRELEARAEHKDNIRIYSRSGKRVPA